MSKQLHHPSWEILKLAVVISPFWVIASDWSDGSELKASAIAAGVGVVMKMIESKQA